MITFSPSYLLESQATLHSVGLSTSTPVHLLQHPSCPPVVHSVGTVYTLYEQLFTLRNRHLKGEKLNLLIVS